MLEARDQEDRLVVNARRRLILPAELSWFEWRSPAAFNDEEAEPAKRRVFGVLCGPSANPYTSAPFVLWWRIPHGVSRPVFGEFDLREGEYRPLNEDDWVQTSRRLARQQGLVPPSEDSLRDAHRVMLNHVAVDLMAILLMLASPKVAERREVNNARLNRQRARNGKPPLLDHYEVRLSASERSYLTTAPKGGHADRIRHFVRRFMRIRRGRMEFVRSHWRGDPDRGIRHPNYRIT